MINFNAGQYAIYNTEKTERRDDFSPVGSRSPEPRQSGTGSNIPQIAKQAKRGIAAFGVARAATTIAEDIGTAQGNETLMNQIGNATTAAAFGVMAFKAPPIAIGMAANEAAQTIVNYRRMQRENANRRQERKLEGARTSNNRFGGAWRG